MSDSNPDESHTPRTLEDVLDGFPYGMVATSDGARLRARPLALQEQEGPVLRFLVSTQSDWVQALETGGSPALVTFSDLKKGTHVALEGSARTVEDRAKIKELYDPVSDAFFESEDDPRLRLLEVTVAEGEWWDSPHGRVGQAIGLIATKVTGDTSKAGDQGPVTPA